MACALPAASACCISRWVHVLCDMRHVLCAMRDELAEHANLMLTLFSEGLHAHYAAAIAFDVWG
eukprot:3415240-Karenia_brevis.AAC.1